jgi:hypothetical protein
MLSSYVNLGLLYSRPKATDVVQLQGKIAEMGLRIRQLEDALAIFQSGVSSEPHPLLRDELLGVKFPPERGCTLVMEEPGDDITYTIDALGILTIGDQGAKYYGPSAGTEVRSLLTEDIYFSNSYLFRRCSWYDLALAWTNKVNKCFG